MTYLINDLKDQIARSQCVAVVGTGVAMAATRDSPVASWQGLLDDGVNRCEAVAHRLPDGWTDRVRGEIYSTDMDELLSAAEKISRKLGAPDGGEYRLWLRESVGTLRILDRDVIDALNELQIPLVTTNYDGLLEEITDLKPVTWLDGPIVERVVRGDERRILHLHGYWEDPKSVVLGIRSYEKILGDAYAQTMLKALRATRTLMFVGYGAGLRDPNFSAFLSWTRKVFAGTEYRHYRLALERDVGTLQNEHQPEERIQVISFGTDHWELPAFLRQLTP